MGLGLGVSRGPAVVVVEGDALRERAAVDGEQARALPREHARLIWVRVRVRERVRVSP